ncbi:hypothetical protein AB0J52_02185 [Spirillospora sp. NPDC049652]
MTNWEALSDLDAEVLVRDLLSVEWKVHVETFRKGPDQGIDLRVFGPSEPPLNLSSADRVIGQVKHYPNASTSQLKAAFKKEAARNIRNSCTRYIVVTTAKMSPAGKEAVASVFDPPLHPRDVFGREDLEALLARHKEVERRHYRLWLTDTTALTSVLNNRELGLRRHVIDTISREAPLLVQTRHFRAAKLIMNEEGSVIIAGPPGVGKTSTAHLLAADLISKGWELIVASDKIDDAERLRDHDVKQVVFYDDFLGASLRTAFLDGKNEDARLLALLESASRDQNLKVILTTREYVLAAARQSHPRLLQSRFDVSRLLIDATELDAYERAEMTYRRIYHSPNKSILDQAISANAWLPVIGHHDFNPRLVQLYMESCARMPLAEVGAQSAQEFIDGFVNALDDPSELWRTIYDDHLTDGKRYLLQTLVTMPSFAVIEDLIELTARWTRGTTFSPTEAQWRAEVRVLDGDFISTFTDTRGHASAVFANASISSYVSFRLAMDSATVIKILNQAVLFEQVERIFRLIVGRLPLPPRAVTYYSNLAIGVDYEREVVGHVQLTPINEQEYVGLQAAMREAVVRTCSVGHYSRHPSFANLPNRWTMTNAYTVDRIEIALSMLEAFGLDNDADLANLIVAACETNLHYCCAENPLRLVEALASLKKIAPPAWVDAIGRLIELSEPPLFQKLVEGCDFIAAFNYLNLTGRSEEAMSLGDKLRNAMRIYSPRSLGDVRTISDLRAIVSEFREAASLIGRDLHGDLSDLEARLEGHMRAYQDPSLSELLQDFSISEPATSRWEAAPKQIGIRDLSWDDLLEAARLLVPRLSEEAIPPD